MSVKVNGELYLLCHNYGNNLLLRKGSDLCPNFHDCDEDCDEDCDKSQNTFY